MSAVKINAETVSWAKRYQAALRRYLRSGTTENPPFALRRGRQAATLEKSGEHRAKLLSDEIAQALLAINLKGGEKARDKVSDYQARSSIENPPANPEAALDRRIRVSSFRLGAR